MDITQDIPRIIDKIRETYALRQAWHRAEKTLTLQARAVCYRLCSRDKERAGKLFAKVEKLSEEDRNFILVNLYQGDEAVALAYLAIYPIIDARTTIELRRRGLEKELEALVKFLPIADWMGGVGGFGPLSLASIVGAAGDLHNYATVQRLWKRLGVAVMADGRQRLMRDAEKAKEHGYCPDRRSLLWNIGASLLRAQSVRIDADEETGVTEVLREAGPFRRIYDRRKAYEAAKNEAGDYADQAARRLREANFGKKTEAYKAYSSGRLPKTHLHARAQRYMEKAFLWALWTQWRQCMPVPEVVWQPELSEAA